MPPATEDDNDIQCRKISLSRNGNLRFQRIRQKIGERREAEEQEHQSAKKHQVPANLAHGLSSGESCESQAKKQEQQDPGKWCGQQLDQEHNLYSSSSLPAR